MANARRRAPAISDEGREAQLASLAMDLAEKQLRDGSASPSVITHFLKVASTEGRTNMRILNKQASLIDAKTENLQGTKRIEDLYESAMSAWRRYAGHKDEEIIDEDV